MFRELRRSGSLDGVSHPPPAEYPPRGTVIGRPSGESKAPSEEPTQTEPRTSRRSTAVMLLGLGSLVAIPLLGLNYLLAITALALARSARRDPSQSGSLVLGAGRVMVGVVCAWVSALALPLAIVAMVVAALITGKAPA
jgi:hypothetical protein